MNEVLALVAIVLVFASGLVAVGFGGRPRFADQIFTGIMMFGSSLGLLAAIRAITGFVTGPWSLAWSVPGGALAVELDALAGMFIAPVFLIGALGAVYGSGGWGFGRSASAYWSAAEHPRNAGKLRIFYGLMVAGMALLVIARNSILFLVGWEIMALSAFMTMTTEDHEAEVRQSGFVYLVATRVGTLFVIATFAVLGLVTGSFSLSVSGLDAGAPLSSAIFLLGLVGFGLKAGLMPLHVWLPGAHANAPSHVSALMSGVLIKMGIYGLFRLCSLFDHIPVWWGLLLFSLGTVSAVLGVAFAIGQHDLKRLLAYHSVENIGIIVMGFGIALLGQSTERPALVALGLAGALLHVWNHGLFKALLFLSAGSVIRAAGTRQIDELGGLAKKLPMTAFAFLLGAAAICGLPPLNGFVSELFVYLAMFQGAMDLGTLGIAAALGVPMLAMVGALAVTCFVKVFGIVFLGERRSPHGRDASESPWTMLGPMLVLGVCCVFIGALPLLVAPWLDNATAAWLGGAPQQQLRVLAPLEPVAWTNALLALLVLALGMGLSKMRSRARVRQAPTWDCGYASPSPRMQYTASSFAEWIVNMFAIVLRPRLDAPRLSGPFPGPSRFESHVPEVVLDLGILPTGRRLARVAGWFRWIQHGHVHLYLLYVLGTLLLMLFIWR